MLKLSDDRVCIMETSGTALTPTPPPNILLLNNDSSPISVIMPRAHRDDNWI